jgi:hypothetical protein
MLYSRVEVHLPTLSPVLRRGFVVTPSGGCKRSDINPVDPVVAARWLKGKCEPIGSYLTTISLTGVIDWLCPSR